MVEDQELKEFDHWLMFADFESHSCFRTTGERPRKELLTIRGVQVMLDRDLAELYGVEVGQLMRAFNAMRKALASIAPLLARIEETDRRQIVDQARNEERFKLILDAMQNNDFPPQKIFYDGQIYDAFEQMKKFVRMAKKELIVIDPYFDDSVLPLIAQKRKGVKDWKCCQCENVANRQFQFSFRAVA